MTLHNLLNVVEETQKVDLRLEHIEPVCADAEALVMVLNDTILRMIVSSIEAEDGMLKVWVKERD